MPEERLKCCAGEACVVEIRWAPQGQRLG